MSLFIFFLASVVLLIGVEFGKRKFNVPVDITRKFAHFGAAMIAALSPIFLSKQIIVLACFMFAIVMLFTRRTSFLSSIQNIQRDTLGDIFLPLGEALTAILFLPYGIKEFQYGVLILGLSDPVAGFVGEKFGSRKIAIMGGEKSLEGACAFFICSVFITFIFLPFIGIHLVLLPLMLTLVELLLGYGSDNLVLPVVGAWLLKGVIY